MQFVIKKIEGKVYDYLKKNRRIKNAVLYIYQSIFSVGGFIKPRIISGKSYEVYEDSFFGFHDRISLNKSGFLLAHKEVAPFINGKGEAKIGYYDVSDEGKKYNFLASTTCCNYQQGSMLTWFSSEKVIFNNLSSNGNPITQILDMSGNISLELPFHFYSLSNNRKYLTSICFKRFERGMPGYGYDNGDCTDELNTSFFIFCLENNKKIFEFDLSDARNFVDLSSHGFEYFSHSSFSPNDEYCYFLYRSNNKNYNTSVLLVVELKTGKVKMLNTSGMVSHLCWLNNSEILAYCSVNSLDGYYVFNVDTMKFIRLDIEALTRDGHPSTFTRNGFSSKFITDCYPDRSRRQSLYECDSENLTATVIFDVYSRFKYRGVDRVDFHPRYSECGRFVTIDSPHGKLRSQVIVKL